MNKYFIFIYYHAKYGYKWIPHVTIIVIIIIYHLLFVI
jgi:hypothetical protein